MDLSTLRDANFSSFGEAVSDWQEMTKKLKELQEDAKGDLTEKVKKASWTGVNSKVTREFVKKTADEFTDAHTQASSIAKILKDTKNELVTYQRQLRQVIEQASKKCLKVVDTGDGTFVVTDTAPPPVNAGKDGDVRSKHPQDLEEIHDEVQLILKKATESDSTAKEVLIALVDSVKYGFSDASYPDRDHAAQALKDAEKMARMARHPESMSLDDIKNFNTYMSKYHDDPLFAERFATKLGPKETLQFWTDMANGHKYARGEELGQLKTMQKNLSMTLATASFSDSSDMTKWKNDLLKETDTSFRSAAANPSAPLSPTGALGFQVISSLMKNGKYDTEFLDAYGEKLIKADRLANEMGERANDIWKNGYEDVDLVFGKEDGRDPMDGFLHAESKNPESAIHTFDDKKVLDHLLRTVKYTDRGPELSHALEAALVGVPYGETPQNALPHTATQVRVTENLMHAVADPTGVGLGSSLISEGRMGASFGHIAAAYMPEISRELQNVGSPHIFVSTSDNNAGLEQRDVVRFLSTVSLDPNGRAGILYGENIYTDSLLEAHMADPALYHGDRKDVLHAIGNNAGLIESIVANSVADEDVNSSVKYEKDTNEAFKSQGEFFKAVLAAGVGVGSVALVPEAKMGALVGALGGGFAGGVSSMAVDRMFDGRELEGAQDEAIYRNAKILNHSREAVAMQTEWATEQVHAKYAPQGITMDEAREAMRVGVNEGWNAGAPTLGEAKDRHPDISGD